LEIAIELKMTSQATNVINQILSFLAYGGSSIVKTLNQASFHLCRMVRVEVELSASVGGFPVDFGGQCRHFPVDQNIKKDNGTVWLYFHGELDGRPSTIEVADELL
jgi:hypothetical protein